MEFGSAAQGEAWGYLNAKDAETAAARVATLRRRIVALDQACAGPYFGGDELSVVDAVHAPLFRFFDALGDRADQEALFGGLERIAIWRGTLRTRPSVIAAVSDDYAANLLAFLRRQGALVVANGAVEAT